MQCAFKPVRPAYSSRLLSKEARPLPRAIRAQADSHGGQAEAAPLEVAPLDAVEAAPLVEAWGNVLSLFQSDKHRREIIEEEYGPYAVEALVPRKGERLLYTSSLFDRMAMEGSGEAH